MRTYLIGSIILGKIDKICFFCSEACRHTRPFFFFFFWSSFLGLVLHLVSQCTCHRDVSVFKGLSPSYRSSKCYVSRILIWPNFSFGSRKQDDILTAVTKNQSISRYVYITFFSLGNVIPISTLESPPELSFLGGTHIHTYFFT